MSKVLFGFTLGLIAGLLIAPDKGSESRKKLERAGRDLKINSMILLTTSTTNGNHLNQMLLTWRQKQRLKQELTPTRQALHGRAHDINTALFQKAFTMVDAFLFLLQKR